MKGWLKLSFIFTIWHKIINILAYIPIPYTCSKLNSWICFKWKIWKSLPVFKRHFISNIFIGLVISILLMSFHHIPWLMNIEDSAMDWMIKIRSGKIPTADIPSISWINIDDKTHQNWGEPLFTPRDKLKSLIEIAVQAKAKLIIVDIDLARASQPQFILKQQNTTLHPSDQVLLNYLNNYSQQCQKKTSSICPVIILTRTFRSPQGIVQIIRPSFLDKAVDSTYIQWASPIFYYTKDQVIRRWWLWQPTCDQAGHSGVIASVELLAATLVSNHNQTPQQLQKILEKERGGFKQGCSLQNISMNNKILQLGTLKVHAGFNTIFQRIMYNISWNEVKNSPSNTFNILSDNSGNVVLDVISADNFIKYPNNNSLQNRLKGKIVIIGNSHYDSRDFHQTPIGKMPGVLIIINALHSLLVHDEIDPLPPLAKLLVSIILIILMSLTFTYFNSFWGMIISGATIILILLPISIILLSYGIWIDFAIPLLVVQLYQMIAEFKETHYK